MNTWADSRGAVYVLYRSATEVIHRDMYLLVSRDKGASFQGTDVSPWNVGYCVMSTEAFAGGPSGVLAACDRQYGVARRCSGTC